MPAAGDHDRPAGEGHAPRRTRMVTPCSAHALHESREPGKEDLVTTAVVWLCQLRS